MNEFKQVIDVIVNYCKDNNVAIPTLDNVKLNSKSLEIKSLSKNSGEYIEFFNTQGDRFIYLYHKGSVIDVIEIEG